MTLDEARRAVGLRVVYRAHARAAPEVGVISSVVAPYVFVRYGVDLHAKATRPEDLELERLTPRAG